RDRHGRLGTRAASEAPHCPCRRSLPAFATGSRRARPPIRPDVGCPTAPAAPLAGGLAGRRLSAAALFRSSTCPLNPAVGRSARLADNGRGEIFAGGLAMSQSRYMLCLIPTLALPVALGGCPAAIVAGLGAAGGAGYAANQERGAGGAFDDAAIK